MPNWDNLFAWLKSSHTDATEWVMYKPSDSPSSGLENLVLGGLFVFVDAMRTFPFEDVEKVLLEQRVILAGMDDRWND